MYSAGVSAETRIREIIEDLLRPLLQADGGDVELISFAPDKVRLHARGTAAFGVGCHYVRGHVIEPAIRQIVSPVEIEYELEVPTPVRRS